MNSNWSIQILLLFLASHCDSRPSPRRCERKFHFDFERGHPSEYEGGIWQGLEGRVTFRGGKAWLDGHGSLTYPFFSHNDLRSGFAFSFKIKPAKIAPGGRVAIITNGVDAGSSTLTVFHNGTCLGVKVVEIAETWNPAKGIDYSRNVELSVDYTKQKQRLKRSSDTSTTADLYIDPIQLDDDMNNGEAKNDTTASLETLETGHRVSSAEHSGNHGDVAGVPDDGARDDNGESTMSYDIIAVRKLYKEDTNTHSSAYQVDIVTEKPSLATSMYNDVKDTQSTTTTTTTTTTTSTYSDIADTTSTTTYTKITGLPSTSTHIPITETASTTTAHSDITELQSTTTYTPSTTTHIDTTQTASTTTYIPSTTTYGDIANSPSTTTYFDSTETTSTTTYSYTKETASTTTDTPSTTTYSDDRETIERSDTDNMTTNSDSETDTNTTTQHNAYTSSSVSDHSADTLTDQDTTYSAADVSISEQTTPTPQSTTDFVIHRQPSTHSVHIYTDSEQTTVADTVSTLVSGVSLHQQTTMPPTTTSRGPEERVVVPRRNRFLIIPNIFRGLEEEDPDEIEVRLAQDNGVLRLQVGDSDVQETTVGVTEHMKAPRSALRVGAGDGLLAYRGSFDEFSMYDCAPFKFFSEDN